MSKSIQSGGIRSFATGITKASVGIRPSRCGRFVGSHFGLSWFHWHCSVVAGTERATKVEISRQMLYGSPGEFSHQLSPRRCTIDPLKHVVKPSIYFCKQRLAPNRFSSDTRNIFIIIFMNARDAIQLTVRRWKRSRSNGKKALL